MKSSSGQLADEWLKCVRQIKSNHTPAAMTPNARHNDVDDEPPQPPDGWSGPPAGQAPPDPTVDQINAALLRPAVVMGSEFGAKLIAAGVIAPNTRRVIIDAGFDQAVKIYTERFGDVGLLSVDFGDLAEPSGDTMPIRVTHDADEIADHLAERIDGILIAGAKLPESRDDLAAVLAAMLEDLPTVGGDGE